MPRDPLTPRGTPPCSGMPPCTPRVPLCPGTSPPHVQGHPWDPSATPHPPILGLTSTPHPFPHAPLAPAPPCHGDAEPSQYSQCSQYLGDAQPVVSLLHGLPGILHRLVGVPALPVRTQAWHGGGGVRWAPAGGGGGGLSTPTPPRGSATPIPPPFPLLPEPPSTLQCSPASPPVPPPPASHARTAPGVPVPHYPCVPSPPVPPEPAWTGGAVAPRAH